MKRFKVKSVVEEVHIQYIPNFSQGDTTTYKKITYKRNESYSIKYKDCRTKNTSLVRFPVNNTNFTKAYHVVKTHSDFLTSHEE